MEARQDLRNEPDNDKKAGPSWGVWVDSRRLVPLSLACIKSALQKQNSRYYENMMNVSNGIEAFFKEQKKAMRDPSVTNNTKRPLCANITC